MIMNPLDALQQSVKEGKFPEKLALYLDRFFNSYIKATHLNFEEVNSSKVELLIKFLDLIIEQIQHPYPFEPFHRSIRSPFDYYQFGLDIIRPLVLFNTSRIYGLKNVEKMQSQIHKGDNVILFANHQTEPDPQAISLLLEKTYPKIAEEMIFVAGHRVISDPLAIPFSMGRNLLCIYSKKYIETPPEKKSEKLQHNQRVMKKMGQLLSEGGKCIYVAPSGGRDRPDPQGKITVSRFDPQSIEMFWLIAQHSEHPTHFYPLALHTYDLLPPPNSVETELGEPRHTKQTPIQLAFGEEISMENFPGSEYLDKKQKRQARADWIWNLVKTDYHNLLLKT